VQVVFIDLERIFEFAISQKSVVDENTGLPVADRFVNEHRRNGRIHTAGKPANDTVVRPDRLTYLFDLFLYEACRSPIGRAFADVEEEISKNLFAQRRVRDLRMELDAIDAAFVVLHRRDNFAGGCGLLETGGKFCDVIAMAHPNVELKGKFVEQQGLAAEYLCLCMPVFTACGRFGPAAEIDGNELHPVADAQDRRIDLLVEISRNARRPSSVTLDGPPERITPFGRRSAMTSAARVKGWISQ
jgi:hypothetical protein